MVNIIFIETTMQCIVYRKTSKEINGVCIVNNRDIIVARATKELARACPSGGSEAEGACRSRADMRSVHPMAQKPPQHDVFIKE